MEYLIPAVILLLLVGGFITFMVMNATKRAEPATSASSDDAGPGIGADESSPLGDTQQHAGKQDTQGRTTGGQDADEAGGSGEPALGSDATERSVSNDTPAADGRFQRDPIGGEGEARPYQDTER